MNMRNLLIFIMMTLSACFTGCAAQDGAEINAEEADKMWEEFIQSESYLPYLNIPASEVDNVKCATVKRAPEDTSSDDILEGDIQPDDNLEYALVDTNIDGITELYIQLDDDFPFYETWVFVIDNGQITLIEREYGYLEFTYSPSRKAILGSASFKTFLGNYVTPFYTISGTTMQPIFNVGQDNGSYYYYDVATEKKKIISEEELSSYYDDNTMFDWKPLRP